MEINVEKLNESHLKVWCDDFGIEQELDNYFSFLVDGHKFSPKFRAGVWDGKVRLYNIRTKLLHTGLFDYLQKFIDNNEYILNYINEPRQIKRYTLNDIIQFTNLLNVHSKGNKIEYRDYQLDAILYAINNERGILISPTSSGKSLVIYTLMRWYITQNKKCVLIVPNVGLVEQMYSDFNDYSSHNNWNTADNCHRIYSGKIKQFDFNCTISTWQSLYDAKTISKSTFEEIDVLCVDEAHLMSGQSANKLFDKMSNANIRIGTTGTLNGKDITELQLTGLLGPVYRVITTKELMDNKEVTPVNINCLVLDHSKEIKQLCKKIEYQKEMKFLSTDYKRNKFIRNLALSLDGVTLVLFNYIEHGKTLFDMVKDKNVHNRNIHYVSGVVKSDERVDIRNLLNSTKNYREFYFGNIFIKIYDDEQVMLSNKLTIKGHEVTLESDIDDKWIASKEIFKLS